MCSECYLVAVTISSVLSRVSERLAPGRPMEKIILASGDRLGYEAACALTITTLSRPFTQCWRSTCLDAGWHTDI
jgi:hypothetical protein